MLAEIFYRRLGSIILLFK